MDQLTRLNKYRAKKTQFNGKTYASAKEARRALDLNLMQQGKIISDLQEQVPYVLIKKQIAPDGTVVREMKYIADFVYVENGQVVVEDVKGYRKGQAYELFKIKKKLMLEKFGIWIKEI